jgi:hypothetical protein
MMLLLTEFPVNSILACQANYSSGRLVAFVLRRKRPAARTAGLLTPTVAQIGQPKGGQAKKPSPHKVKWPPGFKRPFCRNMVAWPKRETRRRGLATGFFEPGFATRALARKSGPRTTGKEPFVCG